MAWTLSPSRCRRSKLAPVTRSSSLDPARVEDAITARTRALVTVHLFGQPADLGKLLAVARKHELAIVEDAAEAHGARYNGRRIGTHGDAVAWSSYPGKTWGRSVTGAP